MTVFILYTRCVDAYYAFTHTCNNRLLNYILACAAPCVMQHMILVLIVSMLCGYLYYSPDNMKAC